MSTYEIRALGPDTWDAFAALAEKHNGVWGGCFCTYFHPPRAVVHPEVEPGRPYKELLVREGQAHAALVFDGDVAVGWAEYGPPSELVRIYHRKEVETEGYTPPDYRITCLFVDRDYRRKGVGAAAVHGALDLIAAAGGGVVETYPKDNQGKRVSASFLHNGTRNMFEKIGFDYVHSKGKDSTVMRKKVRAKRGSAGG